MTNQCKEMPIAGQTKMGCPFSAKGLCELLSSFSVRACVRAMLYTYFL